jgi:hypothetical protein
MPSRQLSTPGIRALFASSWLKWTVALLAALGILTGAGYVTRCTLLLNVARIFLNHESEVVAQERADAVAIVFTKPPPVWISPMNNQNERHMGADQGKWCELLHVCEAAKLVQALKRAVESSLALTIKPGLADM